VEDLRARTTLFCGVLAFAIALSMLLRGRRAVHLLFAAFATTVAFWYTSQSLAGFLRSEIWYRATVAFTVLLPQFAVHLFDSIVPVEQGMEQKSARMRRIALFVGVPMLALGVSPYREHPIARVLIYSYVFGFLLAALVSLARQGQKSSSRAVRDRVRFLVATGALACTFTLADFIVFFGVSFPPIGAVLAILFLFVLSESLARPRMADIYELSGRLMVSTLLAFALAGIFYCFITYVGKLGTMYLNAVLASIVFLVLFEPLQDQVRSRVHQFFFRERYDLETSVTDLRKRLAHALEAEEMVDTVLSGLERSRRVTSAAIYLIDSDGDGFDLAGSLGAQPNKRLESMAIRPILDRLKTTLSLEEIAMRAAAQPGKDTTVLTAATMLGPFERGALFAVRSDGDDLQGLLAIVDDRVREAFTPEELALIENVASQMGIAIANSRIYARMKERDRLAALGSMAAGLAHEVKNPLGAIKGAAQLLEEAPGDASTREFLSIILEETDRLNRVVGSFLDYARPRSGNPAPIDINAAVKRTVQILSSQQSTDVDLQVELSSSLPLAKIDAEQFRQVLINLVQNAIQAMDGHGRVTVTTARRRAARGEYASSAGPISERGERERSDKTMAERAANAKVESAAEVIEVSVRDTGPGIAPKVLKNLFIPFFTTKDQGTGLGLAISQRLIQNAGGTIEVQSQAGAGTKFTIVLPGVAAELTTPFPTQ
jgi:signal transduction histidine kinase